MITDLVIEQVLLDYWLLAVKEIFRKEIIVIGGIETLRNLRLF